VTKWEGYTVDKPYGEFFTGAGCPKLTDDEGAEHVAAAVRYHNEHESVEEPPCQGCKCVRYEVPGPARPLTRRIETRYVAWETNNRACIYKVNFTVVVAETVIPIGFCRPDKSGRQVSEPLAKETPHVTPLPGDTAHVTGTSKTQK
jgi:hypothetical protein